MKVDDKPAEDGYRSVHLMLIHEFRVLEPRIEMCMILAVFGNDNDD